MMDAARAEDLGVPETTVLAVRPDGYVGMRADTDHVAAVRRYEQRVLRGHTD